MNLIFSRTALMETGIKLPLTAEEAAQQDWRRIYVCGDGPSYTLYEKGDGWLAMLTIGTRTCPILVKDWQSLVHCLGTLNQVIQGRSMDIAATRLDLINDHYLAKPKQKT